MNLAAGLPGTGATVNAGWPGGVDTAMQARIRRQDPERIGGLHERFSKNYAEGTLITPERVGRFPVGPRASWRRLGPGGWPGDNTTAPPKSSWAIQARTLVAPCRTARRAAGSARPPAAAPG